MSVRREFHCDWRECPLNVGTWLPEPTIAEGWTRIFTAGVSGGPATTAEFCSRDHALLWLGEQEPDIVVEIASGETTE